MRDPYSEVLRGHWLNIPTIWRWSTALILLVLAIAVLLFPPDMRGSFCMEWALVTVTVVGILLWFKLRAALMAARSAVYPSPVLPIVAVFVALAIVLVIVIPFLTALFVDSNLRVTLAAVILLFAVGGWWATTLWTWLMLLEQAICFSGCWMFQEGKTNALSGGKWEGLVWSVMAGGLAAVIANVVALCKLREESRWFKRKLQTGAGEARARMTGQSNEQWESRGFDLLAIWLPRKIGAAGAKGAVALGREWSRLGRGTIGFLLVTAIVVFFAQLILLRYQPQVLAVSGYILFIYAVFVPVAVTMNTWLSMWKYLEAESLRPLKRMDFLRGMGVAVGLNCIAAWIIYAGMFAGWWVLDGRNIYDPSQFLLRLLATLAMQFPLAAVGIWLMRFRSQTWMTLGYLPAYLLCPLPLLVFPLHAPSEIGEAAFAVLIGLGIAVFVDAIRRWRTVELG
jgi:hypothetical protein